MLMMNKSLEASLWQSAGHVSKSSDEFPNFRLKNRIMWIQVCVFCLDEDKFGFCDKCSKVACCGGFRYLNCMDLCEGCDKWFCDKCQKD